jgi:hypothetical protein
MIVIVLYIFEKKKNIYLDEGLGGGTIGLMIPSTSTPEYPPK